MVSVYTFICGFSILLVYMLVFMSVPCCFVYCSFVVWFEITYFGAVIILLNHFGYWGGAYGSI